TVSSLPITTDGAEQASEPAWVSTRRKAGTNLRRNANEEPQLWHRAGLRIQRNARVYPVLPGLRILGVHSSSITFAIDGRSRGALSKPCYRHSHRHGFDDDKWLFRGSHGWRDLR